MKVKSAIEEVSFQAVSTVDEATISPSKGRFYLNVETFELLVGDGAEFRRRRIHSDTPIGEMKTSILTEVDFQSEIDDTWVLAHGTQQDLSDLAQIQKWTYALKGFPSTLPMAVGLTDPFTVEADGVGYGATLLFDGVISIPNAVAAWNLANPTETITYTVQSALSGDIPRAGESIVLHYYVPDTRGMFLRATNEGVSRGDLFAPPFSGSQYEAGYSRAGTTAPHSHNVDLFPLANGSGTRSRIASTQGLGYTWRSDLPGWQLPFDKNPRSPLEEEMRQITGLPGTDVTNTLIGLENAPNTLFVNHYIKINRV